MRTRIVAVHSLVAVALAALPPSVVAQDLPYTFFLTRYEMDESMDTGTMERVRYHSDGQPFAKSPDGSIVTMSGQGSWDPSTRRATGGGRYTITDPAGTVRAQGTWRATSFVAFDKLPGGWDMPGLKEESWQGPPGSVSFSGFLKANVTLDNLGDGVLEMWCLMPGVAKPGDHESDGISLTGGAFNFTDYHDNEKAPQGVMFYSTNPAEDGYVLTPDGTTRYRAGAPAAQPSPAAPARTSAPAPAQLPR